MEHFNKNEKHFWVRREKKSVKHTGAPQRVMLLWNDDNCWSTTQPFDSTAVCYLPSPVVVFCEQSLEIKQVLPRHCYENGRREKTMRRDTSKSKFTSNSTTHPNTPHRMPRILLDILSILLQHKSYKKHKINLLSRNAQRGNYDFSNRLETSTYSRAARCFFILFYLTSGPDLSFVWVLLNLTVAEWSWAGLG